MKKYEIIDKLEEMWEESNATYLGSGEAELDYRENVAEWIYELMTRL